MSNSPAKPAAAKAGAGTSDNVAEVKGASTPAAHKTAETSSEKAPTAEAKAAVSDTKTAETNAKAPEANAKVAISDTKSADSATSATNSSISDEVAQKVLDVVGKVVDAAGSGAADAQEMVNIKMLRSHPRLAYAAGNHGRIPKALYDELLADGPFFEAISEDGEAIPSARLTSAQLAKGKKAYERFIAVADTEGNVEQPQPEFADLPEAMQCAFVAAADPTYSHKSE